MSSHCAAGVVLREREIIVNETDAVSALMELSI